MRLLDHVAVHKRILSACPRTRGCRPFPQAGANRCISRSSPTAERGDGRYKQRQQKPVRHHSGRHLAILQLPGDHRFCGVVAPTGPDGVPQVRWCNSGGGPRPAPRRGLPCPCLTTTIPATGLRAGLQTRGVHRPQPGGHGPQPRTGRARLAEVNPNSQSVLTSGSSCTPPLASNTRRCGSCRA